MTFCVYSPLIADTHSKLDMFSLFKTDPSKALQKQYDKLLADAMQAQRKGDIRLYSQLSQEAEDVLKKLDSQKE